MTQGRRIAMLAELAGIRREAALAALHRAAQARQAAGAGLAAIDAEREAARAALAAEPTAAMGRQADRFERWAAGERARHNLALARATAEWMELRDAAARAHGQNEVLGKLAARAKAEARAEAARRQMAAAPPQPPAR